jgi:hypothetical protein
MDGTKQMTANQMRLDRARAKIQKEQELHAKTARISGIFGDRGGGNKKDVRFDCDRSCLSAQHIQTFLVSTDECHTYLARVATDLCRSSGQT